MFKLEFDTANAAFEEDDTAEVARILDKVSEQVSSGAEQGNVFDYNGNVIGHWTLEFDFETDQEEPSEDDDAWNDAELDPYTEEQINYKWNAQIEDWIPAEDAKWDGILGTYVWKHDEFSR